MTFEEIMKTGTQNETRNALIDTILGSYKEAWERHDPTHAAHVRFDVMDAVEWIHERGRVDERAGVAQQSAAAQRRNITIRQASPQRVKLIEDAIDKISSDKTHRSRPTIRVSDVVEEILRSSGNDWPTGEERQQLEDLADHGLSLRYKPTGGSMLDQLLKRKPK
jgi:hypothetical protein